MSSYTFNVSKRVYKAGDPHPHYIHHFRIIKDDGMLKADVSKLYFELVEKYPGPEYNVTVSETATRSFNITALL